MSERLAGRTDELRERWVAEGCASFVKGQKVGLRANMTMTESCEYRGYEIVPRRQWSRWCVSVYPTRPDLPILSRSTLSALMSRREEALAEARKRIDRILSNLLSSGA
jgi:hypothetical protein